MTDGEAAFGVQREQLLAHKLDVNECGVAAALLIVFVH